MDQQAAPGAANRARSPARLKMRAMQIIDELEPVKRGGYGGAVGWYLSYTGELDTCNLHPHRRDQGRHGARPGRRRHGR